METDDAVEILHTIGREKRELILDALDEDIKKEIRLIASFDEDEIGSRMTTNCIILHEGLTVKDAMNELVRQAEENDNMTTLFVVDETDCFYGAIALKDLIVARAVCRWKASLPHRSPMCTPTRPSTTASNS